MGTGAIDFQSIEGNSIRFAGGDTGSRTFKNLIFRNAQRALPPGSDGEITNYRGGFIDLIDSGVTVTITGCTFNNCYVPRSLGTAIILKSGSKNHVIENSLITGCTGGASGIMCVGPSTVSISGCTFTNNKNSDTGTLWVEQVSCHAVVTNCKFNDKNISVFVYSGTVSLTGCTVYTCRIRNGTLVLSGVNKCDCIMRHNTESETIVSIAAGATINLQGSSQNNAITGSITAEGDFTLIDVSGTSHTIPAGSYSTIHRDGTYE